uniref:Uncharacterized protein n=1 Tax=Arundo donax TaxID=35708 RepID=A0A0A9DII5_ARUDO
MDCLRRTNMNKPGIGIISPSAHPKPSTTDPLLQFLASKISRHQVRNTKDRKCM